jgi:hypothetical protein
MSDEDYENEPGINATATETQSMRRTGTVMKPG